MTIRSEALKWFGDSKPSNVYTSKFYPAKESWSKQPVWWFVLPAKAMDLSRFKDVNFLAEKRPGEKQFHHLKVPVSFLIKHEANFHRTNGRISLYFSADPKTLFTEQRGKGNTDFSQFLI